MTLNEISHYCEQMGFNPVSVVGALLDGAYQRLDVFALLLVVGTQSGKDTLEVA